MNGTELAKNLNTSTKTAWYLIRSGQIKAEKKNRKWAVDIDSFHAFRRKNRASVKALKSRYVDLYWQGLTVEQLQRHVKEDFSKDGIVWPIHGFAEQAIYESLMEDKRAERKDTNV